ncbi:hypothetical protein N7449_010496 [Penicillium cf. viridicatum]|uniref:Uncharacterized protein n=1 Tax=Penicillium cf. viridicatum TaxID=2972119 RepID=A0A9W9J0E5_9EURO|nr:hypothetical protein N7449_010496 [Penicillium cf. viridicatum]
MDSTKDPGGPSAGDARKRKGDVTEADTSQENWHIHFPEAFLPQDQKIEGGPIDTPKRNATIINLRGAEAAVAGYIGFQNVSQLRGSLWDDIEAETDIKFPTDEPLKYPVPVMGPLQGEGPMEPFGRAWDVT